MKTFVIRWIFIFSLFTTLCCEREWLPLPDPQVSAAGQMIEEVVSYNYHPEYLNDFSDAFCFLSRGNEVAKLPTGPDSFRSEQSNTRKCIDKINHIELKTTFVENSIHYVAFLVDKHLDGYYLFSLCRLLI